MPLGAGLTEGHGAAHAKSSTRRVEVSWLHGEIRPNMSDDDGQILGRAK